MNRRRRHTLTTTLASIGLACALAHAQGSGGDSPREVRTRTGIRLVLIPAGSFEMGSNIRKAEQPVHRVTIREFWLGATEVTQAQWQAVMGDNPSHFTRAGADAPVEMVTWDAAQVFVRKLGEIDPDWTFRLPSEAEWEYACRAGGNGELYGPAQDIAWIRENAGGTTHPVGQKRPNAFGLYDILGNVQEWVQDRWFEDHTGAPADGSARTGGTSSLHPVKGGGWDLPEFFLHAALRDPLAPVHRLGLRVAATPRTALERAPKMGEAIVWYLGHMGWAVRTARHLIVFDYDGRGVSPDEPSLSNGSINPSEIQGLQTTVFITHSHRDHYAPGVFDWKKAVNDIAYVAGFKPEGKDGYVFMAPRETKALGGLNITTTMANDEGVGFFVKVDGLAIFHAGDHSAAAGDESFKPEIDFLAGRGLRADLLFMPISPTNDPIMNQGVHYAMAQLSAGAVFPGHVGGREDVCGGFARDATNAGMTAPIHCPEFPGDHFAVIGRLRVQLKQAEASEADRDRTHRIDRALDAIGLGRGLTVAEVGAGPGYLVEKLARRVGPGGRVYAEDITARMLDMLTLRMTDRKLANFETILGSETDPRLPAGSLDMVLICTTMHMVASPVELLRSIVPSLKPGGRLVLIEPVQGQAADPWGRPITESSFRTREAFLDIFAKAGLAIQRIDATTVPFYTIFVLRADTGRVFSVDAGVIDDLRREDGVVR